MINTFHVVQKTKEHASYSAAEQIPFIIKEIEADEIYYQHVEEICRNLGTLMNYFYKKEILSIQPFGSSITKLALKGSDVDVFLDFGGALPDTPDQFLRSLKNKIKKYGFFKWSIPILARVPILQCVHRSGITCDISFINGLGVSNSNLIKFLISLDNRIRPLILMLKFLMKKKGLIGSSALTSYALIILTLFFLQKLEKPLTPTIKYLQASETRKHLVADWDTSFTKDLNLLPHIDNKSSIIVLLKEFFEFYAQFEFGFYVITCFAGEAFLKPTFSNIDLLPKEYTCYKENVKKNPSCRFESNKFMCVQGPFNHGHNITRNVTEKVLQQFQNICHSSLLICLEEFEKNGKENEKSDFFEKLFGQGCEQSKKKQKKEQEPNIVLFVGENVFSDCLSDKEEDLRCYWYEKVLSILEDILIKVMKCSIRNCNEEEYELSSREFDNGKVVKLLLCDFQHMDLVTNKRNESKHEFDFPQTMTVVNQEELISNYLCDTILKASKKVSLKFEIVCVLKKGPTCLCLHFKCKEESKGNKHLVKQIFQFMQSNCPKWIKATI